MDVEEARDQALLHERKAAQFQAELVTTCQVFSFSSLFFFFSSFSFFFAISGRARDYLPGIFSFLGRIFFFLILFVSFLLAV